MELNRSTKFDLVRLSNEIALTKNTRVEGSVFELLMIYACVSEPRQARTSEVLCSLIFVFEFLLITSF